MLNAAQQAVPEARLVRRGTARAAIVQAARRVAERHGLEDFSLSAVAEEAGFGPSTVFGHFRNKDELLAAVVAEDLAAMAALMRESSTAEDGLQADHELANEIFPVANEGSAAAQNPPEPMPAPMHDKAPDAVPDVEFERRSVGHTGTGTVHSLPTDASVECRLQNLEREVADLGRRVAEAEGSTSWAVSISKDTAKSAVDKLDLVEVRQAETLQNLTRRMDETEQRQRAATAEMRSAMNDTATRIHILESARRNEPGRVSSPDDVGSADPHSNSDQEPLQATVTSSGSDYAAAAERAASAAVLLADMDQQKAPVWRHLANKRVRIQRTHYFVGACAAVIAFVMGAFFAFYVGEARGHELAAAALSKPAATAPSPPVHQRAHSAILPAVHASQKTATMPLEAAAQGGNAAAQLLVGLKYFKGDGIAPDQPRAAQWILRAAAQQQPMAEYWLATMYEHGDGIAADSAEAVHWYEAAAAQGNRKAMHALGVDYAEGRGTSKNYSEAARWFSKAASLGLVNSQFNLGVLYERGLGVPQSLSDAYKWYAVAAAQGDQESATRIEVLKTQLSADDLAAAGRAAQSFRSESAATAANTMPVLAAISGSERPR